MNAADRVAHVEHAARAKLSAAARILVARELRRLGRVLEPGERLATLAQGRLEEATGLLAVTNRRILFIGRQLVIEERQLHAQRAVFAFDEVRDVEATERRLSGSLVVHDGSGRACFADVNPPERATEIQQISRSVLERAQRQA